MQSYKLFAKNQHFPKDFSTFAAVARFECAPLTVSGSRLQKKTRKNANNLQIGKFPYVFWKNNSDMLYLDFKNLLSSRTSLWTLVEDSSSAGLPCDIADRIFLAFLIVCCCIDNRIFIYIDLTDNSLLSAFVYMNLLQFPLSAFSEIPSLFDAHTSIYHPCPGFLSQIALLLPWECPSVIS